MPRALYLVLIPALVAAYTLGATNGAADKPAPRLAHMVFFALKDRSPAARQAFVASCQKYLTKHEGAVSFSVGQIAEDVVEPVSVRDFDVALHVVFEDKAARDKYLVHPRHTSFVEENKPTFAGVRVFDSYLAAD